MKDKYIPGTRVSKDEMHGITGKEFLDKIFFMSDGIMLNRIRHCRNRRFDNSKLG